MLSRKYGSSYSSNNLKQTEIQTILAFCKYVLVNFSFKNFNPTQLEEKAEKIEHFYKLVQIDRGCGSFLLWVRDGGCGQPGDSASP